MTQPTLLTAALEAILPRQRAHRLELHITVTSVRVTFVDFSHGTDLHSRIYYNTHSLEGNCPNSYAYAFDEGSGTALWTCDSALNADYTLTFCP